MIVAAVGGVVGVLATPAHGPRSVKGVFTETRSVDLEQSYIKNKRDQMFAPYHKWLVLMTKETADTTVERSYFISVVSKDTLI